MNYNEIIQLLKNNQFCNFIGIAITPLHSNGIDAVLRYLRNKGETIQAEIFIFPHGITGNAISEQNFVSSDMDIKFNYMDQSWIRIESKISKLFGIVEPFINPQKPKKTIYIAWTKVDYTWMWILRRAYGDVNIVFMIIDDGAASYENPFFTAKTNLLHLYSESGLLKRSAILAKEWLSYNYENLLTGALKRRGQIIISSIFLKRPGNSFERNTEFSSCYVDVLQMHGRNIPKKILALCENAVLFNTQCLSENSIMTYEQQLSYYSYAARIIEKTGYKILIKPHPREQALEGYRNAGFCVLDEKQYSQESIIANCAKKPICVISIFSSTLLNAYGLFGISAISLAKIVLNDKNISSGLKSQLLEYIQKYDGMLLFPNNYDELEKMISHEKRIREGSNNEQQ